MLRLKCEQEILVTYTELRNDDAAMTVGTYRQTYPLIYLHVYFKINFSSETTERH